MVLRLKYQEILLAIFLTIVMVRTVPFSLRQAIDPGESDAGAGIGKQLLYVGCFLVMAVPLLRSGLRGVRVPLPFVLLLAFGAASIAWSAVPLIALRRLALTALVALTLMLAMMRMRPAAILYLLRQVTLGLAIATLASGFLFPQLAIHQPGDPEPSIVGAWRGVFYHKNLAGGVMGLGLLLAVEALLRERRLVLLASAAICTLALYLTASKTSGIAALTAIIVLLAFRAANRLGGRNPVQATILRVGVSLGLVTVLVVGWFGTNLRDHVLDPEAFSGRGQLWDVIIQLVRQRPLLGYGYESVFQAGDFGVLSQATSIAWIHHVPHSHNGPLDLLVTVGTAGLALFLWAMVADPWRRLANLPDELRETWQPVIAAMLSYALIHSMMEGKMFSAESMEWPVLVIALGIAARLGAVIAESSWPADPYEAAA